MEQVFVVAKKSFINGIAGSVTRKQRLLLPKNIAQEFVAMGLVDLESKGEVVKKPLEVKDTSNPSQETGTDGQIQQSASLPVATASQTNKSEKPKKGRPAKTGK